MYPRSPLVSAVWRARRDGVGCDCDISLFETALSELAYVGTWSASRGFDAKRMKDSAHPSLVLGKSRQRCLCVEASPCATVSYALTQAASGATIEVSGTIKDHLDIASPVTITTWVGGPAGAPAVLDGTANGTVVTIGASVLGVTLKDLTVQNGAGSNGGGILNGGTLMLTNSTLRGNAAGGVGGGIDNDGTMTVTDSTVGMNSAPFNGGGIADLGILTVIASTISGNTVPGNTGGGGIFSGSNARPATLGATIVAGNSGDNCDTFDAGSLSSAGYNLTNDKTGTACSFKTLRPTWPTGLHSWVLSPTMVGRPIPCCLVPKALPTI